MNKFLKSFSLIAISLIFVMGCNMSVSSKADNVKQASIKVCPYLNDSSRTAIANINWDSYTYELKVVENPGEADQKPEEILFSGRSYEELGTAVKINLGKYKFTLSASKNGTKILAGSVIEDLNGKGNTSLLFRMFALAGSTGNAEVTVTFPIDGAVSKVEAKVSKNLFDAAGGNILPITNYAGDSKVVFTSEGLPANTEQYALFWFYDAAGTEIYSCSESLQIVGGETAISSITLTSQDWHTYNCVVSMQIDNNPWISSGKTVTLVDKLDSNKKYALKDMAGGNYAASVAEGTYFIYVDEVNTQKEFESRTKTTSIDYYSVTGKAPLNGWRISVVSGAVSNGENGIAVLKGGTFKYKIEKEKGYESSNLIIKQNDVAVDSSEFSKTYTIENIKAPQVISVSGVKAIEYSITYKLDSAAGSDAKWRPGVSPVTKFTAEKVETLPTIADLLKTGGMFDVWVSKNDSSKVYKTTEGVYENLELVGIWKDAPSVNTSTKVIYANGINLIITENGSATNAYIDLNGDGFIDPECDLQIEATDGTKDFTNYTLRAGNSKGTEIKSDFTFTVTGGQIKSIYGLDSAEVKHANKSVLNISGNAKIGSANPVEHKDEFGNKYYTTDAVEGVMLETITNECVNITGEMENGKYSVICIAPFVYEENVVHDIAIVGNSEWIDHSGFFSYNYDEENSIYNQQRLTFKNKNVNGVTKTYIRLADPVGVVLPKVDEITGDVTFGFTLGNDCVTTECSVFSVMVEDGFFSVDSRTTFTKNETDEEKAIEDTLTYMVQPTATTYETSIAFRDNDGNVKNYVYLQILSSGNQLTPETASDFLSQVRFRRNPETPDVPLKVKVNLETVPAEMIKYKDSNGQTVEYKYFNGSFYRRIAQTADEKTNKLFTWRYAYNLAKQQKFNDLTGYLMNPTSLVENNYIFTQFGGTDLSWIGGSRIIPDAYDQDAFDLTVKPKSGECLPSNKYWTWMSGPEAGQKFWNEATCKSSAETKTESVTKAGIMYDENGKEIFTRWNNQWMNPDLKADGVTKVSAGKYEPNNNSNNENCMQFLAKDGYAGLWNDQREENNYGSTNYTSTGCIVEFTPYGNQNAKYQSIKCEASY